MEFDNYRDGRNDQNEERKNALGKDVPLHRVKFLKRRESLNLLYLSRVFQAMRNGERNF